MEGNEFREFVEEAEDEDEEEDADFEGYNDADADAEEFDLNPEERITGHTADEGGGDAMEEQ